jgi:CRISPR-associated protein Cas2
MVVLILERATPSLRGELTRWLVQAQAGVFVGFLSARVRDLLWRKALSAGPKAAGIIIYSDDTEQGFSVRSFGRTSRDFTDFEGLFLAKTPTSP